MRETKWCWGYEVASYDCPGPPGPPGFSGLCLSHAWGWCLRGLLRSDLCVLMKTATILPEAPFLCMQREDSEMREGRGDPQRPAYLAFRLQGPLQREEQHGLVRHSARSG